MSGQPPHPNGSRLRAEMVDRQISVADLSRVTGVSDRLIVKYRTGTVIPRDWFSRPSANAMKIAHALEMDVDELFPPREQTAA